MTEHTNELGQPIGESLASWTPPPPPPRTPLQGRFCRLEIADADRHAEALYEAYRLDRDGRLWTYMPVGPFPTASAYVDFFRASCLSDDPLFHVVIDLESERPVGVASLMRIAPAAGSIETGNICYSNLLQGRPAATECMYLLMRRVFELGYRRYEWKCDSLNAASRRAAKRLGFEFEGIFRQALVYKGRNRDTAWFSIIDSEWPVLRAAFEAWLEPENFDAEGKQKRRLSDLTRHARAQLAGEAALIEGIESSL